VGCCRRCGRGCRGCLSRALIQSVDLLYVSSAELDPLTNGCKSTFIERVDSVLAVNTKRSTTIVHDAVVVVCTAKTVHLEKFEFAEV
jgi:hypothetical protein